MVSREERVAARGNPTLLSVLALCGSVVLGCGGSKQASAESPGSATAESKHSAPAHANALAASAPASNPSHPQAGASNQADPSNRLKWNSGPAGQSSPSGGQTAPTGTSHSVPPGVAQSSHDTAPKAKTLISLGELANRRDLWPLKIKLTKKVGFSPTEIYAAGSEYDLVEIAGQDLHVDSKNGVLEIPAASTDVLERASALMASLTPDQLAVTAQSLPQHPELWPVEVTLTRTLDFSAGNKVPAGRTVILRKFEGGELNLYDRQLKNFFTAAVNETDVLARARERVKLAAGERDPFFGRAVGAALDGGGDAKTLAKSDYILVYQAKLGCTRCAAFLPELQAFYDKTKPSHPEFEAVFVSADPDAASAKQLAAKEKLPGRAVAFEKRLEAADLGTQVQGGELLPLVFLYDRDGKLLARNQPNGGKPSAEDVLAVLETKLGAKK
jgi:hypothetical protein